MAGRLPALAATVTVFEDRHFVLAAPEQAGNILLMGQHDQQGYGNGEAPVKGLLLIENIENENGEGNACQDRAQGNETGHIQYQQKDPYTADGYQRLHGQDHPEQGSHPLPTSEISPEREDMAYYGGQAQAYHKIGPVGLIMQVIRKKYIQAGGHDALNHIDGHYESSPSGAQDAESIRRPGITATVFADIDTKERLAYPYSSRDRTDQVC